MSAHTLVSGAHYKYNVLKQMSVTGTAQVFTPLASTDNIVGRPENIFVQALAGNTGKVMVGFSNVAANGSTGGWELSPGANLNLPVTDISSLYVIGPNTSEKIQICYSAGVI